MNGSTMFNAIAHLTTLYYYVHIVATIAGMRAAPSAPRAVHDFMDFKPKFFTIWGVVVQTLLFALCVLHDATRVLSPANAIRRSVRGLRDLVLVGLAAPAALTISAMFWSLYLLDRDLVMPPALDAILPVWLNHAMHTFVVVLVVVQMLAEPHYPPSKRLMFAMNLVFNVAYQSVFFHEHLTTGRWIYPVFAVLGWPGRLALITFTAAMFFVLAMLTRAVVKARWGRAPRINSGSSSSRSAKKRT